MKRLTFPTFGVLLALVTSALGCEPGGDPPTDTGGSGGGGAGAGGPSGGGGAGGDTGGAGGGTTCATAADCPLATNECIAVTCENNRCGEEPVPAGTAVPAQTPGDCKVVQCDGRGKAELVIDDGDAPDDGLECTEDVCNGGVPAHPTAEPYTPCGGNGELVCNLTGDCVACVADADCGLPTTECETPTCRDGVCGVAHAPEGTLLSRQTDGDCQKAVCDGSGGLTSVADPDDLPDDDNPCTGDTCVGGAPQFPNQPAGTSCAPDLVCDGNGNCAGCSDAGDCPGSNHDCKTPICTDGLCGFAFAPNGTVSSTQTPGDCKQNVCDGNGNLVPQSLDTDLPPEDGAQCTTAACNNGTPLQMPAPVNTPCNQSGGSLCSAAGTCVECNAPTQCSGMDTECQARTCDNNTCGLSFMPPGTATSMQIMGDCKQNECDGAGLVVTANLDTDVPADGNQCTNDVCTAGAPSNPPAAAGTSCNQAGGTQCNGTGLCVVGSGTTVTNTLPANGANIPSLTQISVTFNTAMDPTTLTGQTMAGTCAGTIQVSSNDFATCIAFSTAAPSMNASNTTATLVPAPALAFGTTYKIKVLGSVTDAVGVPMGIDFTHANGFTTNTDFESGAGVVISQVYPGGGNNGATFTHDFIELHNRGPVAVDIGGWSVQYVNASGTTFAVHAIPAGTMIQPGRYFLLQQTTGGANGAALPTPDLTGGPFAMAIAGGKVALVNNTTALTGACPAGPQIVDFLGYGGGASCSETAPSANISNNQTSAQRRGAGCQDSNNNAADFSNGTPPVPRNGATTALVCSVSVNELDVASELDFCNLQHPPATTVIAGAPTETIYAQAYEPGSTEAAGPAPGLVAQIGYGPVTANPQNQPGWTWIDATFNVQVVNNDEWQAQITAPSPGTYRYAARFSYDGVQWTYCDLDGAGSNGGLSFEPAQLGTMTVNP